MHMAYTFEVDRSLICIENIPLKQPMPIKNIFDSLCIYCIITAITFLSASFSSPTIKYSSLFLWLTIVLTFEFLDYTSCVLLAVLYCISHIGMPTFLICWIANSTGLPPVLQRICIIYVYICVWLLHCTLLAEWYLFCYMFVIQPLSLCLASCSVIAFGNSIFYMLRGITLLSLPVST